MEYIPAGFMLIARSVFVKVAEKFPELYFKPKDPSLPDGFCFFNTVLRDGEFWGEDYQFCYLAREAGVRIWVDPEIQFDHAGNIGCMLEILSDKCPADQQKPSENP